MEKGKLREQIIEKYSKEYSKEYKEVFKDVPKPSLPYVPNVNPLVNRPLSEPDEW